MLDNGFAVSRKERAYRPGGNTPLHVLLQERNRYSFVSPTVLPAAFCALSQLFLWRTCVCFGLISERAHRLLELFLGRS